MFKKRKLEMRIVEDATPGDATTIQTEINIPKEDIVYIVRESTKIVVIGTAAIIGTVLVSRTVEHIVTKLV